MSDSWICDCSLNRNNGLAGIGHFWECCGEFIHASSRYFVPLSTFSTKVIKQSTERWICDCSLNGDNGLAGLAHFFECCGEFIHASSRYFVLLLNTTHTFPTKEDQPTVPRGMCLGSKPLFYEKQRCEPIGYIAAWFTLVFWNFKSSGMKLRPGMVASRQEM